MENESELNKIRLPTSLALIVWQELKEKHDIEKRKDKSGSLDMSFTSGELGLIKRLNIKNPIRGSLEGISQLYNLQNLSISSEGRAEYKKSNDISSINDKDIKEIGEISSLVDLSINNQAHISYVDLEKLTNLKYIDINKNLNLDEIDGIDNQKKLSSLSCYGNKNLLSMEGLNDCIKQNPELSELNLDVLLFPDAINYNSKKGEYDKEALDKIDSIAMPNGEHSGTVKWIESINGMKSRDKIEINHYQMKNMHNKSCEILSNNVKEFSSDKDTVIGIELYLAKNVEYDNQGRKHKLKMTSKDGFGVGPVGGTNSAYNAIMFDKCVCEGYTRAMQYLLKLKDIKSRNVMCIAGEDTLNMASSANETRYTNYNLPDDGYHSIICIEDVDCLYDDPCWNAGLYQKGNKSMPWTLKTKEEISKDHTLSFAERIVDNNHLNVPKNAILQSIEKNNLFAQTRLSEVKDIGNKIIKEHKGQIIYDKGAR